MRFYAFISIQGAGLCLSNNFSQIVRAVAEDPDASTVPWTPAVRPFSLFK